MAGAAAPRLSKDAIFLFIVGTKITCLKTGCCNTMCIIEEVCMWTSSFRYDKKAKRELDFITSKLGLNKSQAVNEAIHVWYEMLTKNNTKSSAEIFLESGFVGGSSDETLLSTNYKDTLTEILKEKYGACESEDNC